MRPRRLLVVLAVVAALAAAPLTAGAQPAPPSLLTDPYLQAPTATSSTVAWVTEWPGVRHLVVTGEDVADLSAADAATLARRRRLAGGPRVTTWRAETIALSRTREDAASDVPGRTYGGVTDRPLWRHEATVRGLRERIPYRVLSITADGEAVLSDTFTLAPKPRPGEEGQKILLTSDHQLKENTPANLQKVVETVGRVDAVFLAGDLVNVPDRASEWFDDASGLAFFPGMQGTTSAEVTAGGTTTAYHGGEILQHAPLYPTIGNHEVMGRFEREATLGGEFNDPQPRWVAEQAYAAVADEVNPTGDPEVRERWIADRSWNTTTYEELFTVPTQSSGTEKYYAETFGDVRLITLFAANIWRTPSVAEHQRGRFREAVAANHDPDAWGWGQFPFERIDAGSEQYEWLQQELRSPQTRRAEHVVVMLHHSMHGLGDNAFPAYTDPVQIIERDAEGEITRIRYEYPLDEDHLVRDVEPLLSEAGVDLVFFGHSHVWNRTENAAGVDFIETSNVGNDYGAFHESSGRTRAVPPEPWNREWYVGQGDQHGLEPIVPNVNPLTDEAGRPLPYVASSDHTVFSILDTGTGTVTSYVFDLRDPDGAVEVLDRFPL